MSKEIETPAGMYIGFAAMRAMNEWPSNHEGAITAFLEDLGKHPKTKHLVDAARKKLSPLVNDRKALRQAMNDYENRL
ncbi:hypothetical protein [Shimazuella alba]|uniref:Uncharacterized protein n=1 Tax=Shimazuella alba TaxID=2690964 RepID=A0A6I4VND8_9BACL|nr:hypothetical protein [Shimazuella alba]MXQ53149.1 hypothetical protein [Shimazuella alba]